MTLKEILKHKKLYVAKWEDVTEEAYEKTTVFDMKSRKPLIRVLRFDEETKIYFGNKEQNLDSDMRYEILKEVDDLHRTQQDKKAIKKHMATEKVFEQRKKAVYKELLNQIQK